MKDITLEELLEAGCHFGHQVTRQNPKARDFVFESRDNIHIIDLGMTKAGLDAGAEYIRNLAKNNGTLVVVGSKRQAQPIIAEELKRAKEVLKEKAIADNIYSVTNRWIGGTLTNTQEVTKNYKKLKDFTVLLKDEFARAKYTKKELGMFDKERQKLEMYYGGIVDITTRPDALFIIDTHTENLAVMEANRMNVKTVGMVDTNADPSVIDFPIPANDDAVGSIKLIVSHIVDAWIEGRELSANEAEKAQKAAEVKTEKKVEEAPKVEVTAEAPKKEEKPQVTKPKAVKKEKTETVEEKTA